MPAYGTKTPTSLSPGDWLVLVNNENLGTNGKSVSFSRGVMGNSSDQGVTFVGTAAFTVQGAYQDAEASYVTIKDVNATLGNLYQTTVDRFRFYRVIVAVAALTTVVAMR